MNKQASQEPAGAARRADSGDSYQPNLDQHDSVRAHMKQRLNREVADLEARIDVLRHGRAPHKAIIIATYERMIARKIGFMSSWNLRERDLSPHH